MNDAINKGLEYLLSITPEQWSAIGTAVATSGILSPVLMAIKKGFKIQKDWLMFGVVVAACFAVVGIAYTRDAIEVNPVLATTLFTVMTNFLYFAVYKPLQKKVVPKAVETWAEARLYKARKQSQKQMTEDIPGRVI